MSKPLNVATNATDLPETRFQMQQDASATFAANKVAGEALFQERFQNLTKPVDGRYLDINQLPIRTPLQYGVAHFEPLDTRVLQHFGLKTGGGYDQFGWLPYQKKYSCYGE
jgi:hypothetical protein